VTADYPKIAVAASGAAIAVWEATDLVGSSPRGPSYVEAAVRQAGAGRWSLPMRISDVSSYTAEPMVAINNDGTAVVVWVTEPLNGVSEVQSATIEIGKGGWSKVANLAASPDQMYSPEVTIDPQGNTIAVWRSPLGGSLLSPNGVSAEIGAAFRPARTGTWRRSVSLGREVEWSTQDILAFEFAGPQIAVDARGDALVVWQGGTVQHLVTDVAVWAASARKWSVQAPVSGIPAQWPQVATSPDGHATVLWIAGNGRTVDASSRTILGCRWRPPTTLTGPAAQTSELQLKVDQYGDAIATWAAGQAVQFVRRKGVSGHWDDPVARGGQNGGAAQLAFAPHRNAVAVWVQPGKPSHGLADNFIDAATYTNP
jgi:hypothetical protein